MKIFLDFDDVIFNTKKFAVDLKKTFAEGGIEKEDFDKDYLDYPIKGKNGIRKYNAWQHLKFLRERGLETEKAELKLNKFMERASEYVFSDVHDFLKSFKKDKLYLISYGDNKFQNAKISNAKIAEYFDGITVTDNSKAVAIKKRITKKDKKEKSFFIEDRLAHVEEVKKKNPQIKTFLIKRKEGRYNDKKNISCDFEVKNLKAVRKIILQLDKNGKAK